MYSKVWLENLKLRYPFGDEALLEDDSKISLRGMALDCSASEQSREVF
jgi:hypothetical protein